jgi:hypothetical protein
VFCSRRQYNHYALPGLRPRCARTEITFGLAIPTPRMGALLLADNPRVETNAIVATTVFQSLANTEGPIPVAQIATRRHQPLQTSRKPDVGITLLFLNALIASWIRPQSAHSVPSRLSQSLEDSLTMSPDRVTQIRMSAFSPNNRE